MRLNYPMKSNGMYILRAEDFDDIARLFLSEYAPAVLQTPQPLDIDYIINDCLFLEVRMVYLAFNGQILGLMAFGDADVNCLNRLYQPQIVRVSEATMLLDYSLTGRDRLPRLRYTKMHETSHWICHRTYHSDCNQVYDCRTNKQYIACRTENVERYASNRGSRALVTDSDWEEWQADRLAAALLMPRDIFIEASKRVFRQNDIRRGYLLKGHDVSKSIDAVEEIAEIFKVSKKATQIRLQQVGLLFTCENELRSLFSNYL